MIEDTISSEFSLKDILKPIPKLPIHSEKLPRKFLLI